jgi:ribonuclease HI
LIGSHAACGGLFRDHLGSLLGAFACNIGHSTVFYAEVYAFLLALEYADQHGWRNVWLESDSTSALMVFTHRSLVPILLRNRWYNACNRGIQVITSHIFREGNCCADSLANLGHSIQGTVWFSVLPQTIQTNFFLDRTGFPRSRMP